MGITMRFRCILRVTTNNPIKNGAQAKIRVVISTLVPQAISQASEYYNHPFENPHYQAMPHGAV